MEKWKRSLNIYLEAMDIRTSIKKRATLLLLGGAGIQEIFYNLPGASVEPTEDNDVFAIAIQKLDEYFSPKQSKVYERHVFRLIKQEEGEKFEKFVVRLRNQAEKCQFDQQEDHLIDQVAEKCLSVDLRKKILTIGDNITLDRIIAEANTLEVVNRQLEEYGQPKKNLEVNSISQNKRDGNATKPYGNKFKYNTHKGGCSRCGNSKHNAEDTNCPARKKKCYLCDKLGHFRQYCKSHGARKRRLWRKDRQGRGGGIGFYIKNSIQCRVMDFQIDDTGTLEYMWISLIVNRTSYCVCVIYRPPRSRLDVCINFFDNALPQCLTEFDNIVVLAKNKVMVEKNIIEKWPKAQFTEKIDADDTILFQNFTRMSRTDFENLLELVTPHIQRQDTNYHDSISPRMRLAITLRFLATGDSYKSLMYLFQVSYSTISLIVPEVCEAISSVLKDYIKVVCLMAEYFIP
nr:unnamed protein product [Callosobruchus analis]